jgi:hypothetical protein
VKPTANVLACSIEVTSGSDILVQPHTSLRCAASFIKHRDISFLFRMRRERRGEYWHINDRKCQGPGENAMGQHCNPDISLYVVSAIKVKFIVILSTGYRTRGPGFDSEK